VARADGGGGVVSDEFELEHWKSRATLAEAERDSARSVLAALRSFHRDPSQEHAARLLARRKEHDVAWWNVEHAIAAVSEALDDIKLGRPVAVVPRHVPCEACGDVPEESCVTCGRVHACSGCGRKYGVDHSLCLSCERK
jgi:hypothetical protein